MKIDYISVNNIRESILASALPMSKKIGFNLNDMELEKNDIKRAIKLGSVKNGTGHDCFLKGITVFMIITAPEYWWKQWERYSFQDTVSSTSSMHKILEFNLNDILDDDIYPETKSRLQEDIKLYKHWENKDKEKAKHIWKRIIKNIPMDMKYTRAVTTNYLQLKTMYKQRKNHKLDEWQDFINFLEELPYFKEFIKE